MNPAVFFIKTIIAVLILCLIQPVSTLQAAPSTNAEAVSLIDVQSGRILYSHQGDQPLRIASLTKVMTAIVAIENGNLDEQVKVSRNAYGKEGSSIYLKLGEKMSLHHMLYGLMLRSGNDAATAIAEHIGGSVEGFAFMMNEKAQELGMTHSNFMNPHGLDEEGHYASANDLAKLAAYALKNEVFKEIVKTKKIKVPNPYEPWDHVWYNKNRMLSMYEGADGVKTGYTKLAHRTLITSATRNGQQLAAVTLNDGSDWIDHSKLFDYGFNEFSLYTLIKQGQALKESPYVPVNSFIYPLKKEERQHIKVRVALVEERSISHTLGERGKLTFLLKDQPIGSVMLVEPESTRLQMNAEVSSSNVTQKSSAADTSYFDQFLKLLKSLFSI